MHDGAESGSLRRMDELRHFGVGRVADGGYVECAACGERVSNSLDQAGPALEAHYTAAHPDLTRQAPHPDSATRADLPWLCFVCGMDFSSYPPEEWPWGPDGISSSFDFCPCCGVEFGYEDASLTGVRRHRLRWQERGMPWSEPKQKPPDWNPSAQISAVPERAR